MSSCSDVGFLRYCLKPKPKHILIPCYKHIFDGDGDGDGDVSRESGWHNAVWWNREPSVAAADGWWANPQEATYRGHCHCTPASAVVCQCTEPVCIASCQSQLVSTMMSQPPVSLQRRQSRGSSWRWALSRRELAIFGPSLITRWAPE